MSGVSSLSFRNVLGISRQARPNVLFVGEEYIVFPAGNSVVVHNINSRQQRIFLPPEKFSSGISAIAIAESEINNLYGTIENTVPKIMEEVNQFPSNVKKEVIDTYNSILKEMNKIPDQITSEMHEIIYSAAEEIDRRNRK